MTIILLASVSLFALVVTGRPILSSDSERSDFAPIPSTFQTSVQAAFRIHPGKDDLTSDAARFHFEKTKQQIESPSSLGKETVAAVASFHISPEEQPSFETLFDASPDQQDGSDINDEQVLGSAVKEKQVAPPLSDEHSSAPLAVLAFSCIAAFLALACTALALYIIKSLQSKMLASKTAWDLVPRLWGRTRPQQNIRAIVKDMHISPRGGLLFKVERLADPEEGTAQSHELHPGEKPFYFDAVSDMESEWDDVDEKYQDALDMTPLPLTNDLPPEDNMFQPSYVKDSPVPSAGLDPLDQPMNDRSTCLIRELCSSPVSRPAWSVRAIDCPALGLSSRESGVDSTPQPLIHPHRRAYRSPVPEFDIALAMQLRPGLGIGADSAWTVRFLMAIFGWFAVALTGNAR